MKKDKNKLAIRIIISRDISHFDSKLVLTSSCCECIVTNVVNGFLFDFFFIRLLLVCVPKWVLVMCGGAVTLHTYIQTHNVCAIVRR